jgi:hypothetical protein
MGTSNTKIQLGKALTQIRGKRYLIHDPISPNNMSNTVNRIVGLHVQSAHDNEGSLHLGFEADVALVIHNKYNLHPRMTTTDLPSSILGRKVTGVRIDADSLEISMGGIALLVDLKSEAWSGPEAAVLYEGEIPLVVWS